jgi:F-type H+-transporting ATPase subunit epsilon
VADEQPDIIQFELCAPERAAIELQATEVTIPGGGGVFTVLPNHTPLLSTVLPGVLMVYTTEGEERVFSVNGGFAEVMDNKVLVLAQTAEQSDEIDIERAESARDRAETLLSKRDETIDMVRAEAALERAMARINAKHGHVF